MPLKWLDASTPPAEYPLGFDGLAFYIGGNTPHVWTPEEIKACPYRYRLPIFVRSDPTASGVTAAADVSSAVTHLAVIGAPKLTLVAWDSETSVDPTYIQSVYPLLKSAGYLLIDYGSQSFVFGNENPDGYYWGADWTNVPHIHSGDIMTQFESLASWDDSWSNTVDTKGIPIPFWDTKPKFPTSTEPPGQWNDAGTWTWQDAAIIGKGLDGNLHCFVMAAGGWERMF